MPFGRSIPGAQAVWRMGIVAWCVSLTAMFAFPATSTANELHAALSDEFTDFASLDLSALLDVEVESGSGFAEKQSVAPAAIQSLSREEIARFGIRDLRELLLWFLGTYVHDSSAAGALGTDVAVRSSGNHGGTRILVLLDDRPLNDEVGEYIDFYAIPIEAIEQAEFLRGPAAVLYGSSAMAGVLRLRTREPGSESFSVGGTLIGDPVGRGGDASAFVASARSGQQGRSIGIAADIQGRLGEHVRNRMLADLAGVSGEYPKRVTYVTGLATLTVGSARLRLLGSYVRSRMLGLTELFAAQARYSRRYHIGVDASVPWTIQDWMLTIDGSVDYRDRNIDIGLVPPPVNGVALFPDTSWWDFDGLVVRGAATARRQFERVALVAGVDYRWLTSLDLDMRINPDGAMHPFAFPENFGSNIHDANVKFQGTWELSDHWRLIGGGRLNVFKASLHDVSGQGVVTGATSAQTRPDAVVSPMGRGGLVWLPIEALTVKALAGRAFALPRMADFVGNAFQPSAGLKPEFQDTFELILDSRPGDIATLRVGGFYNRISKLVRPEMTTANVAGIVVDNADDVVQTWGGELELRLIFSQYVDFGLNGVFQEGRDEDGSYLRILPRVIGKSWLSVWPLGNRTIELTPRLMVRGPFNDENADALLDVVAAWRPVSSVRVHVTARNVLNTEPAIPYGRAGLQVREVQGAALRLGVSARF